MEGIHVEKANIACSVTDEDRANDKLRMNMEYKPKMNVTH
jgi:hypothetical protein